MQLKKFEQGLADFIFADADADKLAPLLKAYPRPELDARLAIYKNNVFASLLEAMSDLYPAVIKTVGEDFFRASARAYLREHPPRRASLIEFGETYPDFLASFPPAASLPYLADVARIDLACHQAYHAPEAIPLGAEDFGAIDSGILARCELQIHPSVRLISSPFACFSIWNLAVDTEVEVDAGTAENVLVVRPQGQVNTYSLTCGSYRFIQGLYSGITLGEALAGGLENDASFNPAEAIQFLIRSGLAIKIVGGQRS